jgi:hypothetical protein
MLPLLIFFHLAVEPSGDLAAREKSLAQMLQYLPSSSPWKVWLDQSHELPPDFDALPDMADLPDPLVELRDGRPVPIVTAEDWNRRRETLKALFHKWILGTVPPAPDNLEARALSEREETGAIVRVVELRFGAGHAAKLGIELLIPKGPGPYPVFMTQVNHRAWALIALRRGYLGCIYAGCDNHDDTDTFPAAYPDYDWSRLTRRAWAAGRCIDYLRSVPQARMDQIALTGHSRNGKQSLIASALDNRIAVVISSSSGAGGCLSARAYGEPHFGEGIENITRAFPDWFHPRWRFFVGREHKLPVDLHELVALSAPRACLLSTAFNDGVESSWAVQQTYLSAKRVYALLGAEDRIRILWRAGGHETWPTIIERYIDWCDLQFGRGSFSFPERMVHPWDWDAWKTAAGPGLDAAGFPDRAGEGAPASRAVWETRREKVRAAVIDLLGTAPPRAASPAGAYGEEPDHIQRMLGRGDAGTNLEKHNVMFGEYLNGTVYAPKRARESGNKLPAVLWLHPWSCPMGYAAAYCRGDQAFRAIARAGYAVFGYDQIGFGRRVEEVEGFYNRYPGWSLLGKMVRDAQAALDVLVDLPEVDARRVYIVGYGLGAMVALHLAAVDDRPAGYALVCPPPPFRLDTDAARTGGIRRWSHLYMLVPRLGYFLGRESRVPYDVDDLIGGMAPRPALVVSPSLDREAPLDLVTPGIASAREAYRLYGASDRLVHQTPETYNHFDPRTQQIVVDWLKRL